MEQITQSTVRTIPPSEAQEILSNHNFHLQRAIKAAHVGALTMAMKGDEFPRGTALYFAKTPETIELLDGQHRLTAQVAANVEIEYTVVTLFCKTVAEAEVLYTQMDVGIKRSIADRMKALDLQKHIALPAKQANLLAAGAPYIKYGFGKIHASLINQMTPVQRMEVCREYAPGASVYLKYMEQAEPWIKNAFMRSHFVALGAYLFHHAPETAGHLWNSIATNECGTPSDPRQRIMNLAQNMTTSAIGLNRALVVMQAFIHGWNAMVEGKTKLPRLIIAPVAAAKIEILGLDISPPPEPAATNVEPENTTSSIIGTIAKRFPLGETAPN
jgi:hypothetical protein